MRCVRTWLWATLIVSSLAAVGCGKVQTTSCSKDADCTGSAKHCNLASSQCVPCLNDTHCGADQLCINEACKPIDSFQCNSNADCETHVNTVCSPNHLCEWQCVTGADCPEEAPTCDPVGHKCYECVENNDCSGRQVCTDHACVDGDCANCKSSQYCYNHDRCMDKGADCTRSGQCSSATETCVDIDGDGKANCVPACDISDDTDMQNGKYDNPNCWGGFGWCIPDNQTATSGICIPPLENINDVGEGCQNLGHPELPSYHWCKEGLLCMMPQGGGMGTCYEAPKKVNEEGADCLNGDPSSDGWNDCKDGLVCLDPDGSGVTICLVQPTRTQAIGEGCWDLQHPGTPEYNDCVVGAVCVDMTGNGIPLCVKQCDASKTPDSSPDCAGNGCVRVSQTDPTLGACDDRKHDRTALQTCEGTDPATPDYGKCTGGLSCQDISGNGVKRCAQQCSDLFGMPCTDTTYECSDQFMGYCLPKRTNTRAEGETCGGADPTAVDWNLCVSAQMPCLNGVCAAERQLNRTVNQTCEYKDPTDVAYNSCVAGYSCFGECLKDCDPAAATSGCSADQYCHGNARVCVNKCDPAAAVLHNSTCQAGAYCFAETTTYPPGFCIPLTPPEFGTGAAGASCGLTGTDWCDSKNAGLFCHPSYNKCVKACDPFVGATNNVDCASGDECVAETGESFKGGVCLGPKDGTAGQTCDELIERCADTLFCSNGHCVVGGARYSPCGPDLPECAAADTCVNTGIGAFCLPTCTPDPANPAATCGAGWYCAGLTGGGGACAQQCTTPADCTNYGTDCQDVGFGTPICL